MADNASDSDAQYQRIDDSVAYPTSQSSDVLEKNEKKKEREKDRENEAKQRDVNKLLYSAAFHGDISTVRSLLAGDPRPDVNCTQGGLTLLEMVCRSDKVEIAKFLVANRATLTRDALENAFRSPGLELAEFLIESSSDGQAYVNPLRTGEGWFRNLILDILLNPEHRINDQDSEKNTALHETSEENMGGYVDWLLGKGADPSKKNNLDQTAWDVAVDSLSYDAISAFALKEMERQMCTLKPGDFGIGLPLLMGGSPDALDPQYENWNTWYYCYGGNSKVAIHGCLRQQSKLRANSVKWNLAETARMVGQNFLEDNTMYGYLSSREPSCVFDNPKTLPAVPDEFSFVSLVMPFFYSASLETLGDRKARFEKLTQYHYCLSEDRESFGVHLPLSMDEYCNPGLDKDILEGRNKDQVVLRYQEKKKKTRAKPGSDKSLSVITVPQAWLWKVNEIVMTSLPSDISPETSESLLLRAMRWSWDRLQHTELNSARPGDINLALGMFLSVLVDAIDRPMNAGLSEPIFSIFEKTISNLSEDVNQYTKDTRVDTIDIEKEKEFLHIIDDIREELSMISTILLQQEEVWKDFANKTWPDNWPDGPDGRFKPPERPQATDHPMDLVNHQEIWGRIQRPQIQFAKFKRRISKLDADAERVARAIDRKLDLKATHAGLKEAHSTAIMSAAIFGFTIITIIFTPLSFIVSLFALPIDRFQKDQAGMYSTNYVGKWIATVELISVALTLALMWLMIQYGLDVPITQKTWKQMKVLLGVGSSDEKQDETGAKSPPASTSKGNIGKSSDEKRPESVSNSPIDQSKQEQGSKKHKARFRKLFRKGGTSNHAEENGMGRGNEQLEV